MKTLADWIDSLLSGSAGVTSLGSIAAPTDPFSRALAFTLRWEGGRVDNPDDPGGRTNRGITQATYNAWNDAKGVPRSDVYDISFTDVQSIYHVNYWDAHNCGALGWPLALVHFDSCVQFKPITVNKLLAQSSGDWEAFINLRRDYHKFRSTYPGQAQFLNGWLARCNALEEEAKCS